MFWPLLLGVVGIALLWRQADEAQRERWLDTTGRIDPVRRGPRQRRLGVVRPARRRRRADRRRPRAVRVPRRLDRRGPGRRRGGAARRSSGSAIVVGPWIYRLASDLTAERAERVRTQERADVAAHLHDSVLQTLALIQKNAGDGDHRGAAGPRPGARPAVLAVRRRGDRRAARVASALRGVAADDRGRPRGRPSRWSASATATSASRCARSSPPPARPSPTPPSTRAPARSTCTPRSRPPPSTSSSATGARGFDPQATAGRPARRAAQHHRPDGPPRRSGRRADPTPGEGTEVRLHLPRPRQEETDE